MNIDFRELHESRLRNHPPELHSVSFAETLVHYYDHPGLEIGSVLWDGGKALSQYLATHPTLTHGLTVLELGSGLGITGIVAAKTAKTVHLTDKSELLPLLHRNIEANSCLNVSAHQLVWGTTSTALFSSYDLILGADILYCPDSFEALHSTISAFSSLGTKIILAYKIRDMGETRFIAKLQRSFPTCEITRYLETTLAIFSVE